jgi:arylsulfatase A
MRPNLALLTAVVVSSACYATIAVGGARPNIVVILCDDLGYGDIQAINPDRGKIATPNIDRIVSEGLLFTEAHSSSSVCSPSRYSLLTGRYCWRTRHQAGALPGTAPPLLTSDRQTIAKFLQNQGYATACIGKWHLGMDFGATKFTSPIADGPLQHGFDHFFGIAASLDMVPLAWIEDDHFTEPQTEQNPWKRSGKAAPGFEEIDVLPTLTERAVAFVNEHGQNDERPYFLYLAFASPHTPIVPTAEWQGKSTLGDYADFVMQTDDSVGKVLQAIDASKTRDNTIVIFSSDNGFAPAAQPRALQSRGHYPSELRRGYKADIWDGGHRIPLVVRWPGVVAPGSTSKQLVGQIDLFATIAEIMRKPLPENVAEDSVSLLPILTGNDTSVRQSLIHHSNNGIFAIRAGKWKLEFCAGSGGWSAPRDARAVARGMPQVQLYDMEVDASERHNRQAKYPDVVEQLTQLMNDAVDRGRTTPGPRQENEGKITVAKNTVAKITDSTRPRPRANRAAKSAANL